MKINSFVFAFMSLLMTFSASAQNDSTKHKVTLSAFVDFYYAYDFNKPASKNRGVLANNNLFIYAHNRHNEMGLNNGIVFIEYESGKVHGKLSLHTGTFVQANYANEPGVLKHIYESYVGFHLNKNLVAEAGIFGSHIGAESAVSMDNYTLSRSIMADNTPYYESGVKLTYSKTEKLKFTMLLLNGWQNIAENNDNKAIGTQLQIVPVKNLLLNSSTFIGKETAAFDSISSRRYFHNFYAHWTLKKFSLLSAFDIGVQEIRNSSQVATWYNANLIMHYKLSNQLSVGLRGEYYHDPKSVIINPGLPGGFKTFSPSVNIDYKISENMVWRIEGRMYSSKNKAFQTKDNTSYYNSFLLTSISLKLR
jgi:hypothetical protein